MNFRWSNICALQFLVVLNVNGLKFVPADRTVIKQNGTTRTISRYYLLPQADDDKQVNADHAASTEGEFSKFLREFNPKKYVKTKSKQEPKKKTVERYRIYIKRKLRKPKMRILSTPKSKSSSPAGSPKIPNDKSENTETSPKTVTKIIQKSTTPTTSEDSEEEYILKKKQGEVSVTYPYMIGQKGKKKGKDADNENLEDDEPILRSNDSDHFSLEESNTDQSSEQGTREKTVESTKKVIKKYGEGRPINQTPGTGKKLKQMVGKPSSSKNDSSEDESDDEVTKLQSKTIKPTTGGLNQTHLDQLYREMYKQYTTEVTTANKWYNYGSKPVGETDSQESNGLKEFTNMYEQHKPGPNEDDEFKKLLSTLHKGPEYLPSTVLPEVENYTENNEYIYKSPLDTTELDIDKPLEVSYEDITNTQTYNIQGNPTLEDSYETTTPKIVKPEDVLNSTDLIHNERTTNPLEQYFQSFHNHDTHSKEPTLNVESIEIASNTSYENPHQAPNVKYIETKTNLSQPGYEESEKYLEGKSYPLDSNKTDIIYSELTTNQPLSDYNQVSTEYSKTARSPLTKGYSRGSGEDLEILQTTHLPGYNQTNTFKKPLYNAYNSTSIEYLVDNQTDEEYPNILKKPLHKGVDSVIDTEHLHTIGEVNDFDTTNNPHSLNKTYVEYSNDVEKLYYNSNLPITTEIPESVRNLSTLSYSQEDIENVEIEENVPDQDNNETNIDDSKIVYKGSSYSASNEYPTTAKNLPSLGYKQVIEEYLETVTESPFVINNDSEIEYLKNIKRPIQNAYNPTNTEQPETATILPAAGYDQEDLEYLETLKNRLPLDSNQTDIDNTKYIFKSSYGYNHNTASTERQGTTINPLLFGYNQSFIEYLESLTPRSHSLNNEHLSVDSIKNMAKSAHMEHIVRSTEHAELMKFPPPKAYNQAEIKEYSQKMRNPPHINSYQENVKYKEMIKNPGYKGYKPLSNQMPETAKYPQQHGLNRPETLQSKPTLNNYQMKYAEYIKKPIYKGALLGIAEQLEPPKNSDESNIKESPYLGSTEIEYSENIKYPMPHPASETQQASTKYSKTIKMPTYIGNEDNAGTVKRPPYLVYNQANKENVQNNIKPFHLSYYQGEKEYAATVKPPPFIGYYEVSAEYSDATKEPQGYNQEYEYIQNIKPPLPDAYEAGNEYSEYVNKPPHTSNTEHPGVMKYPFYIEQYQSVDDTSETVKNPFYINQIETEYSENVQQPPYFGYNIDDSEQLVKKPVPMSYPSHKEYIGNQKQIPYMSYQESTEYSKLYGNPLYSYYQESTEYSKTFIPTSLDYNQASIEYVESVSDPPQYGYSEGEYSGSVIKPPVMDNNQGRPEDIKQPPYNGYLVLPSIKYSEKVSNPHGVYHHVPMKGYYDKPRFPPHGIYHPSQSTEYSENSRPTPYAGHNQYSNPEYAKKPFYTGHMQSLFPGNTLYPSTEYDQNSRTPPYAGHNQYLNTAYAKKSPYQNLPFTGHLISSSTEYDEDSRTPAYAGLGQYSSTEYAENLRPPYAPQSQRPIVEYYENSRNPPYMIHNQQSLENMENSKVPLYVFHHPQMSSTEYSEMSRNPPGSAIIKGQGNSTAGNSKASSYKFIVFKEVKPVQQNIVKEKINTGTKVIQGGVGNRTVNQIVQQNNNIDLATLCPECFNKIKASMPQSNDQTGSPIISTINSYAETKPQNTYSFAGLGSLGDNDQNGIELLKQIQSQNPGRPIYLNPGGDQSLYKVLQIVLKGDQEPSSDINGAAAPDIKLFTVYNLKKVLEAFDANGVADTDKESANLHRIMQLIFNTAQNQNLAVNNGDPAWYAHLSPSANPTNAYVYNLLHQKWLQEIMYQLAKNNYNLNVIRNPRWASYLGAWRLPAMLGNNNLEYYDRNHYAGLYPAGYDRNLYRDLAAIRPQADANAILALLQKYLLYAQLQYGQGSIEYYQKQNEILTRIGIYLRERGYPAPFIQAFIRKLYATLNAMQTHVVTVANPQCLAPHEVKYNL